MSAVFHRHCHTILPEAVSGRGIYLYDENGKAYLDGCGGAAVSNLGHQHPDVITAVCAQLNKMAYAHSAFFTSKPAEELAQLLVDKAGVAFSHTYFVSGGSEANESALKLARQYFVEQGKSAKSYIIARQQSYHGNTLGALGSGGNIWRRAPFDPLLRSAVLIPPCYAYRYQDADESCERYARRSADELEKAILQLGADNVMAFIAEPIVGATAGVVPAAKGYFQRVRQICDQHDILLIMDEVMCGVGRTGSFYAFEQEEVVPDIVTLAKGLSGGYQSLGAVVVQKKLFQAIAQGSGFFQHGHTFMAHSAACAAGVAVCNVIDRDSLLSQVKRQGELLQYLLAQKIGRHPHVGQIRGRGLFIGIELVADKESKAPFAERSDLVQQIKNAALSHGLMCYPMSGTIDGRQGHHILLAPPFIITTTQCGELVDKLALALDDVFVSSPKIVSEPRELTRGALK
ncbi:aspartate aminotransferase family protein [Thaumasiovibrio sp. DFM-14]|uniref:aspartate aminotransferase family protein n=1 Tax=Thaumasiovibrio sp. DFM-14 TaxID=3384792 RepID=UPI0039A0D903